MWDATQYEKFRRERTRPFLDLVARIPERPYRSIVDLGCGTGDLTEVLSDRWPTAMVTGIDLSPDMLARASTRSRPGRLDFVEGDLATWRPARTADLIVSNAAFQWVGDHKALLDHVASYLGGNGVLAVQMPFNFTSPSHLLLNETAATGPWAQALRGILRYDRVMPPTWYVETAWTQGLQIDAWETIYQHVLEGKDAVLEWMKGTALRPVLKALDDRLCDEFIAAYASRLRAAYPETPAGTILPFHRLFFVAQRP